MNIIRQRDYLKRLHKLKLLDVSYLKAALEAPCFDLTNQPQVSLTKEECEFVQQEIMSETQVPKIAPFPVFRFFTSSFFDQWFHFPEKKKWFGLRVIFHKPGPDVWLMITYSQEVGERSQVYIWNDGVNYSGEELLKRGMTKEQLGEFLWQPNNQLLRFIFCCMYPSNKVIRVEPDREKASVEWRLARTHYLILHQKQVSTCIHRSIGVSSQMILRAAHWRRAHLRRLTSERYKEKRGRLIPIKHAWVGPTEWTGNDGKIYKIVNP